MLSDKDQENETEKKLSVFQICATKYSCPPGTLAGEVVVPNKASVATPYTEWKVLINGTSFYFACIIFFT